MEKSSLLFLVFVLFLSTLHAQNTPTCHDTKAIAEFAMLSDKEDFVKDHKSPNAFTYAGKGEMITFKTSDGKDGNGFFIKNSKPTNNYIFVFQEWWGLNDNIKDYSQKLFDELGNVNVLAIDMYDGKVTSVPDSARSLMQGFKLERGVALVEGAKQFAGSKAKIGTIGWCFGGSWSLQASILSGNQAAGCVMFYGMPEKEADKLKKLHPEVLGIFASKDKYITPEVVKEFESTAKSLGKKVTVKIYDADHGFANPSNPIYNKAATEDAWKLTLAFFKRTLK
jgi:carboxymethylenebutenolidase